MADTAPQGHNTITRLQAQARAADQAGNAAEAQALRMEAQLHTEMLRNTALDREDALRFSATLRSARQHEADMQREAEARLAAAAPAVEAFNESLRKAWRDDAKVQR